MADATSPAVTEVPLPPMKAFRKLASMGASFIRGRYIETGEVVLLTENQAQSWRDRFEAVDSSAFKVFTEAGITEAEKVQAKPAPAVPPTEPAAQTTPHATVATPETK